MIIRKLFLCVVEDLQVPSLCSEALRLAVIAARRLSPLPRSFCLRASAAAFRSSDILMKRIQRYPPYDAVIRVSDDAIYGSKDKTNDLTYSVSLLQLLLSCRRLPVFTTAPLRSTHLCSSIPKTMLTASRAHTHTHTHHYKQKPYKQSDLFIATITRIV